jgi:hypothetical protein
MARGDLKPRCQPGPSGACKQRALALPIARHSCLLFPWGYGSGEVFLEQGAVFDRGFPVECPAGVGEFQKE